MGSQKCGNVGKSQSVLVTINPTISPRSRTLNASKTEARIFIGIEPVSFTGEKLA
jgi:hypothetical protein|eukprot:COSAG01_NODE_6278_length_3758_cov_6.618748_4_plen_55_part_00